MLLSQEEQWHETTPPELGVRNNRQRAATPERTAPSSERTLATEARDVPQFRFRILVVDDEPSICEVATYMLESEGYEVLTAADGVEGLHALSKSLPDLIISDLNMPRMSGFEFLRVVRERFPHIATIAVSGEYITSEVSSRIVADGFLQKGRYTLKELFHEVAALLAASPIRPEGIKSRIASLFVRRDNVGCLIITCPKCLRPNRLEATSMNGGVHQTTCPSCGTPVEFEIDHETEPLTNPNHA